jgi:nitrite reductase/ring-hydroxylating ferredoxin subunit
VAISPWLQDNAGGRAVRCNLHAIEFAADGEPLGDSSGVDVKSLFGTIPAPTIPATPAAVPGGMSFPGLPSFLS